MAKQDTVNTFDESQEESDREDADIYQLKLHEAIEFDDFTVTRVHYGWIYQFTKRHYTQSNFANGSESSVFVRDHRSNQGEYNAL